MVSVGQCERVVVEDCRIYGSDFCGLGLGRSRECIVRRCDLSYNGNTGLGMGECRDCTVEDCTLLFNNYRRFHSGWHAGGMKCIPGNVRCTIAVSGTPTPRSHNHPSNPTPISRENGLADTRQAKYWRCLTRF